MYIKLSMEPSMLLSIVNMKLRNDYPSLEALCEDLEIDQHLLEDKLQTIGYTYQPKVNQFKYNQELHYD